MEQPISGMSAAVGTLSGGRERIAERMGAERRIQRTAGERGRNKGRTARFEVRCLPEVKSALEMLAQRSERSLTEVFESAVRREASVHGIKIDGEA